MTPKRKPPLLFVHNVGPTHVHGRDHDTKTKIRRHIMADIGRDRRKTPRNPQYDIVLQLPDSQNAEQATGSEVSPRNNDSTDRRNLPPLARPFWNQHPLDILDSHWDMDVFSAYGIMLMLSQGRNLASTDRSTESFIFPFAFKKSQFLRHYSELITTPDRLTGVSHEKPTRFKVMALQRSLGTMSCIESGLAGTNLENISIERLMLAILALISFNLISSDVDQATIHLCGLDSLINARDRSFHLHGNKECRLMVFWVDITTSLLRDCSPRFPLPSDLIPSIRPTIFQNDLPLPLHSLINSRLREDGNITHVLSCVMDLNVVAGLLESELTVRGDSLWGESILLGLWLNPVAYRLLNVPTAAGISSQTSAIPEALRYGALLWIISLKRRHHAYPGSPTTVIQKILTFLSQPSWTDILTDMDVLPIEIWLLVLCGINYDDPTTSPSPMDMIALRMHQLGWNWREVMMRVCQMPWTRAFDVAVTLLADKVAKIN
ncbi:hypothetical protein NPX13_g2603 [Xylaria arbuscula]|uniref:Transcription factor domain-containing protein n=1 Tax=Xylaria arbuscula TaxID=114810 RepID=A0A9W8NJG1_9PEZI|nr:hypothetical protein NPX13_g2603 [Xylaria arbuscula]